jgi:hypothetical protein
MAFEFLKQISIRLLSFKDVILCSSADKYYNFRDLVLPSQEQTILLLQTKGSRL